MIVRWWAVVLLLAPFAYVAGLLLAGFPRDAVGVWVGFAVCAAAAGLAVPSWSFAGPVRFTAIGALIVAIAVTSLPPGGRGAAGDLGAGLAVGLLPLAAMVVARTDNPVRDRLIAFGAALAWATILLAARAALPAGFAAYTGLDLLRAVARVNNLQVTGLVGLMDGSGYTSLPLHTLFDAGFAALAGAAMFGLVLDLVRPRSGDGAPLPVATRTAREPESARELQASIGFSPAQRAVFRARSLPEPSPATWPPGLAAVAWGAGSVAAFLTVAAVVPDLALLVALAAALAAAVVVIVLADVPDAAAWIPFGPARIRPPPPAELESWLAATDGGETLEFPHPAGAAEPPPPP